MDQTGPKIQSGGLKKGLFKLEYHGSLKERVIKLPTIEDKKVTTEKNKKDIKLYLFIIILLYNTYYDKILSSIN
jgi:hypothetical protein